MNFYSNKKGSPEFFKSLLFSVLKQVGIDNLRVLDLGAGEARLTRDIKSISKVYVDIVYPDNCSLFPYFVIDSLDFMETAGQFDVILALDHIEHLKRDRGERLLKLVTDKAGKFAVWFTPFGELGVSDSTLPTAHKSGWIPEDFEAHGYDVLVMPKFHQPWENGQIVGIILAWLSKDERVKLAVRELIQRAL